MRASLSAATGAGRIAAALLLLAGGVACAPEPPNALLVVTVDTLRADRLGAYGSGFGLTPHLDALARESVVFEAAYAPAPFTLPSIATLFTGRAPRELGIVNNRSALPEQVPTLAGLLRAQGFATAAVVSSHVLRAESGLALGFERYDDELQEAELVRNIPERVAPATTAAALTAVDALAESGKPWLLWVHYQDPHGPYTPPPGARERQLPAAAALPGADRVLPVGTTENGEEQIPRYQHVGGEHPVAWYVAGYHAEIEAMDAAVGALLDGLRTRGRLDDTVVLFAADHGESLGEFGYFFRHGNMLTDEQVRVPLLLRVPGAAPARRSDVVTLRDVVPTLVALLLGGPTPEGASGRDLLAPGAASEASEPFIESLAPATHMQVATVQEGYKLILVHRDGAWRPVLFQQGNETVDLSDPAPRVVARLRERLEQLRERYDIGTPESLPAGVSDAHEAALRALGYVEDAGPGDEEGPGLDRLRSGATPQ